MLSVYGVRSGEYAQNDVGIRFCPNEDGYVYFVVRWDVKCCRYMEIVGGLRVQSDVGIWRQIRGIGRSGEYACRYMRFWPPEDGNVDFGVWRLLVYVECNVISIYGGSA